MNRRTRRRGDLSGGAIAVAWLTVVGCAKDEAPTPRDGSSTPKAANGLPASFVLAGEPAGARPVKEIVSAARSGDEVVVAGRVGDTGSDRANFRLVDPSLKSCTEIGDECKTPWDYCCTPPDEMAKVSATVVFQDGEKPYAGTVLGFAGLDHLSSVVVKGRAEKDSSGNLTIVASGIFVKK